MTAPDPTNPPPLWWSPSMDQLHAVIEEAHTLSVGLVAKVCDADLRLAIRIDNRIRDARALLDGRSTAAGTTDTVALPPTRDQVADLAHDTFFEHEPVPGEPWVNPWPIFADRFLALLGSRPTVEDTK